MQSQHTFESFDLGAGDRLAINVATGNLVLSHPVVSLPIRGGSLPITLTYNSFDTSTVGIGPGWRTNLDRRLENPAWGSNITFTDGDGSRHLFTWVSATSSYQRPAAIYATLTQQGTGFRLAHRGGAYDLFTSAGLLAEERDRFGNGVTLDRTVANQVSVHDAAGGRSIVIAYAAGRVSSMTDWAYVNAAGEVQATATGSLRKSRFFYDGSNRLSGWTEPLYAPTSPCPASLPAASYATRLTYASSTAALVSGITKTQTVEAAGASALTTTVTPAITTEITYRGDEVASVTDAEQQPRGALAARTWFSRPAAAQVLVRRHVVEQGTPLSQTSYVLAATTDPYARVTSVKRLLGASTWIEQRTAYDTTYPIESASVIANYKDGTPSDAAPDEDRETKYTYVANSMGLVAEVRELLTAPTPSTATYRTTAYTYNANRDITQTITGRSPADPLRPAVTTRSCYDASCTLTGNGLVLLKTIENYVDGIAGNGAANVEDVTIAYGADAHGQRTSQTRFNHSASGTLLDSAITAWNHDAFGNEWIEVRNWDNGAVTSPGTDITPIATGARTDLTTTFGYDTAGNRISTADPRHAIEAAKGTTLGPDDFISKASFDALGSSSATRPRQRPAS
jgi:hypothetical protein